MTIRNKLSVQITIIVAALILIAFALVLYSSVQYRESEFYSRLEEKALQAARLFLDVEEVDSTLLTKINEQNSASLINEKLTIISADEVLLYTTDYDKRLDIGKDEIARLRKENKLKFERNELEVYGFHYLSGSQPYYIFIGAYDKYGKRKIVNLQFTLLFTWIFCVFAMAYAGWLFAGRALYPVSKIIKEVDQINERNIQSRIFEGNGKDELAHLAQTFNNMLNRIENSIKFEKMFLANASHELRNPLTAITSQLEVCLLNERNPGEYINTVKSVLEDIKSLNLLSNQLLLLTRVEAGFAYDQFKKERVDELIFDAVEGCGSTIKNIRIEYSLTQDILKDEEWELTCVRELIVSSFQNIIENAVKFKSSVLKIHHEYGSGFHTITFADNGPGVNATDLGHLFTPFFRAENSTGSKGHGIGLSLVKRILDLHKGEVNISSAPGEGVVMSIHLPQNQ